VLGDLCLAADPNVADWGRPPASADAIRPPPATPEPPPSAVPNAPVIAAAYAKSAGARNECSATRPAAGHESPATRPATNASQLNIGRGRCSLERIRVARKGKSQPVVYEREQQGKRERKIPIPTHLTPLFVDGLCTKVAWMSHDVPVAVPGLTRVAARDKPASVSPSRRIFEHGAIGGPARSRRQASLCIDHSLTSMTS
jgi:hypothetical protein